MQDDIAMALLAQFQSEEFEGKVGSCSVALESGSSDAAMKS